MAARKKIGQIVRENASAPRFQLAGERPAHDWSDEYAFDSAFRGNRVVTIGKVEEGCGASGYSHDQNGCLESVTECRYEVQFLSGGGVSPNHLKALSPPKGPDIDARPPLNAATRTRQYPETSKPKRLEQRDLAIGELRGGNPAPLSMFRSSRRGLAQIPISGSSHPCLPHLLPGLPHAQRYRHSALSSLSGIS